MYKISFQITKRNRCYDEEDGGPALLMPADTVEARRSAQKVAAAVSVRSAGSESSAALGHRLAYLSPFFPLLSATNYYYNNIFNNMPL